MDGDECNCPRCKGIRTEAEDGVCLRCRENPSVDEFGYCGHCHWAVKAEVLAGWFEIGTYLEKHAAFAVWLEARERMSHRALNAG